MLLVWLMLVVAAVASLVALLTLLRNPSSPTHRWLFVLILGACVWVTSVNLHSIVGEDLGLWLLRFAFVGASILSLAVVFFCMAVSGVIPKLRTRVIFFGLAILGCLLSLSPWVTQSIVIRDGGNFVEPLRGPLYPVQLAIILFLLIYGLALLNYHRRRQRGERRSQLTIVEIGLASGALVGIVSNVILPNITKTTSASRFAFVSIIILTSSLVYAVVQHRFLDIRPAATRALAYVTALLIVTGAYAAIVIGVSRFALTDVPADSWERQLILAGITVLAAMTFYPLKKFFDRITGKLFFRDTYDVKEVIDAVSDAFVQELSTAALINKAGGILMRAIKANHIEGVLAGKRKIIGDQRMIVGRNTADASDLLKYLVHISQKLIVADEMEGQNNKLHDALINANVAICVRLETSKELLGYLLVGYKANGAAYSGQDIGLIRIAADELAIAVQNALRFEEIEQFNSTLKKEVEDATKELRESNKQLKELDIVKDEFISMASHQLRTPLTSIKGYISMLLDGDAGKVSPEQHRFLEEAFISSQRMVYLVGDFLNVSRIQTGKFVLEQRPTNLAEVVQDEIDRLQITAEHRNVKIMYKKSEDFPTMNLDEEKMRQVIMNFIDNAIFYSKVTGTVTVDLSVHEDHVRFSVADEGIGVPEAERHNLFGKFFRASNARRTRPDGTGIGLFLAKKVVTVQGGHVFYETKENVGSTFGFVMPLVTKAMVATEKPVAAV